MSRLRTEIPGPRSRELAERRAGAVAAGVGSVLPVFVDHAEPGLLVDVDGNRLIDLGSGIAVTGVGNPAPGVARAVRGQVDRFSHTCFTVTPYEGYLDVCERLAELTPGGHDKRSVLLNSGAEAVENAVKIARHATGRPGVVALDHGYHGRTNLTMALTAEEMPYKRGFGPFTPGVRRVPGSYPLRDGLTGAEAARRAVAAVDRPEGVACVVVEPIQGEGGVIVPAPGFLPALADWCRSHGVLLVADEVQTGFCRTGDWFACDREGVAPDLVATAKGIAGGLPLAAVTGRADVMDAVHAGGLGGTYGGNPIACAAAVAAIDTMRDLDLVAAARRIEATALPRLRGLAPDVVVQARGRGAMLAVELASADQAARVAARCHAAGVIVLTCGARGNVIRLLPPLVIPDGLLAEGLDVLEGALQ
ncbi:4-aminobutyrate--2-oxoglutarate transaminase [Saccharothrix sp. 6-C]|uniref:4-aminobutyrate--2-oxoglutarate transaminase n=1 Tax=Saccharothrix sp. 6-C TaxID=2781735 RepID=UPI001916E1C9|nr:4-aminobutyrate--2-oxoglutarate transaminase [Saccharothrix sp. 6-C]QQQ74367.1 4-aminobutyrate--2-oxoglutarate transaminase [Saccharothrix sp. 6-C]